MQFVLCLSASSQSRACDRDSRLTVSLCEAFLNRLPHGDQALVRAGNRSLYQQYIVLRVHSHNLEVQRGMTNVAHVARHLGAPEYSPWRGARANRAWSAMAIGLAMSLGAAGKA